MARTPQTAEARQESRRRRDEAEQDALMREVDEAVRQGDLEGFAKRYGRLMLIGLAIVLAAFGGYLFWANQREKTRERNAESLIVALDQVEAGNADAARQRLATIEGGGAAGASARMLEAGILSERGDAAGAARLFAAVADDGDVPEAMRDLARIRQVAAAYDTMKPEQVIALLGPMAAPGNPYFASAGELVAHAYLAQNKRGEAGALFAAIAKDANTPAPARTRMLNMAGILGVDAVDDVQDTLERQEAQARVVTSATAPATAD